MNGFEQMIRSAMMNQGGGNGSEPLCMMRDEPQLLEEHKFFDKMMSAFTDRKKKIDEEMEESRRAYWRDLEQKLIAKGYITQKEVDANIGLRFQDGVLFKYLAPKREE